MTNAGRLLRSLKWQGGAFMQRWGHFLLGLILSGLLLTLLCSPVLPVQASETKPPPDTNHYIVVEGNQAFVLSISQALGLLAENQSTAYLLNWMTANDVHIKWWAEAPGDYVWGYIPSDKSIWVGLFTAEDATINAANIALTATYIRDYLMLSQCDQAWLNFRAWWVGYSTGYLLGTPTYYQDYMFLEAKGWADEVWSAKAICPNWQRL